LITYLSPLEGHCFSRSSCHYASKQFHNISVVPLLLQTESVKEFVLVEKKNSALRKIPVYQPRDSLFVILRLSYTQPAFFLPDKKQSVIQGKEAQLQMSSAYLVRLLSLSNTTELVMTVYISLN
jgi:hypothetical protein